MTYKVNDLVYFHSLLQKGVGKIVSKHNCFTDYYLVQSTQIVNGNDGLYYEYKQDNKNNWWFSEDDLKPFTKKEGQEYKVLRDDWGNFETGDIVTLYHIDDDCISRYKKDSVEDFMYDLDHDKCDVEFYEDAKEHKENEMFTKDDLKVGYLVKVRNGRFAHVVDSTEEGHCLNYEGGWSELSSYSDSLHSAYNDARDIMEVYGLTEYGYNAHKFEVGKRKLLWKREEVKEMTIEEIQKVLGHKIKVVE